jgi:hypothetical protein
MWKYDISLGQWAWMSGSNNSFTTLGPLTGSSVLPTPRSGVNVWSDSDSNIWFYGGQFGKTSSSKIVLVSQQILMCK